MARVPGDRLHGEDEGIDWRGGLGGRGGGVCWRDGVVQGQAG